MVQVERLLKVANLDVDNLIANLVSTPKKKTANQAAARISQLLFLKHLLSSLPTLAGVLDEVRISVVIRARSVLLFSRQGGGLLPAQSVSTRVKNPIHLARTTNPWLGTGQTGNELFDAIRDNITHEALGELQDSITRIVADDAVYSKSAVCVCGGV